MAKGDFLSKLYFLHPILLGQFFVLFLYAHNVGHINFEHTLRSFSLVAVITSSMLLLVVLFMKNWSRGGHIVSLAIILFFTYGRVSEALTWFQISHANLSYKYIQHVSTALTTIWVVLFIGGAIILSKHTKSTFAITKTINVFAVILIISSLTIIMYSRLKPELTSEKVFNEKIQSHTQINREELPDIYYLVFDRYARGDVLEHYFSYSNNEFISWLETRGFYVAKQSNANYPRTSQSLASSLDIKYLVGEKDREKKQHDWNPLYVTIRENTVTNFLQDNGYRYIHFGDWWHPTSTNPNADLNINLGSYNEFERALLKTTFFYRTLSIGRDNFRREHYSRTKYKFNKLSQSATWKGPKFIFAHMLIPHTPYVFDEDGSFLSIEDLNTSSKEALYLNQLKTANAEIKNVVEDILSAPAKRPTVIILQADEGPYPAGFDAVTSSDWKHATDDELKIKFGILNAIYMSGKNHDALYQSISPVNSFRVIFNEYFYTNLEILEDQSFAFEDLDHIYSFFNITDRIRTQH
jgi:hypothetical protein